MQEIHVTDISKFQSCRRKHDYSVNQHLKRKCKDSGPLWFGTTMHTVLAYLYSKGGTDFVTVEQLKSVFQDELIKDPTDDRADMYELAYSMLNEYHNYASENDDFEVIDVEKELTSEIQLHNGETVKLIATIDMLIRSRSSRNLFIVDHKNLANFSDVTDLERDFQMSAYLWIANNNGIDALAAIYNMLRKKIPAEPTLLKNGTLSIAKNIDTTYDKFMQAIQMYGLDASDYTDTLDNIRKNDFIRREKIFRTKRFLRNFEEQLIMKLTDMCNPHIYPNETSDCKYMCSFQMLCKAENDGADVDLLRTIEFYVDDSGGR